MRSFSSLKPGWRALEKAGVKSARKGAHLLGHSLATNMLQKGASLDEIGEVLRRSMLSARHRMTDKLLIYAKAASLLSAQRPSVGQQYDKKHLPQRSFDRVRKADEPKWDRTFPELLRFEPADLYVIKGRHKIGGEVR